MIPITSYLYISHTPLRWPRKIAPSAALETTSRDSFLVDIRPHHLHQFVVLQHFESALSSNLNLHIMENLL